jgi:hypothetical protein
MLVTAVRPAVKKPWKYSAQQFGSKFFHIFIAHIFIDNKKNKFESPKFEKFELLKQAIKGEVCSSTHHLIIFLMMIHNHTFSLCHPML